MEMEGAGHAAEAVPGAETDAVAAAEAVFLLLDAKTNSGMVSPQMKIEMHLKVGLRSFSAQVSRCSAVAEMNENQLMEVISKVSSQEECENTVALLLTATGAKAPPPEAAAPSVFSARSPNLPPGMRPGWVRLG